MLGQIIKNLSQARVVCVGDVMLDHFVYGKVTRISPEAPIPILAAERNLSMLGGAGNVVRNLSALGAASFMLGVIGDDSSGRDVLHLMSIESKVEPHLLIDPTRQTTVKTRYIAGQQQILRVDRETPHALAGDLQASILNRVQSALTDFDLLILSDYAKGVLQSGIPAMSLRLIQLAKAHGKKVIVDPKGKDYSIYAGADLLTPNRRELEAACQTSLPDHASIETAARQLMAQQQIAAILVTLGEGGMMLVADHLPARHFPTAARQIFDVSGAGDTVVAALSAALAVDVAWGDACLLANRAAGVVVGKLGTATCSQDELFAACDEAVQASDGTVPFVPRKLHRQKMANLLQIVEKVKDWRKEGKKIGFTNGCFDLLHPGHIDLLEFARSECDCLVVGVNDDASVRRLKGPERPVRSVAARMELLAALAAVDAVVAFAEDTPLALISAILPDILVKGADYAQSQVVGADVVMAAGGRVLLAPLRAGESTSAIIQSMTVKK
ncbi:MAG: D-glycero-beta-D-manno-heptose-7-phosphate kinase [Candidatus Symbiobacter sp.]|nr:D-glycero-beta-D-manno-heptose-7-phosphate kinase [Candidatus Symbiobacter sp.]